MPAKPANRTTREKAEEIHCLKEKLAELDRTLALIEKKASLTKQALKSPANRGAMTPGLQTKIADAYGFSISSPAWRDRFATANTQLRDRKDTIERFQAYLRVLRGGRMKMVAAQPKPTVSPRFAKVHVDSLEGSQFPRKPEDPIKLTDEGEFEPRDIGAGILVGVSYFELEMSLPKREGVVMRRRETQRRGNSISVATRGTPDAPWFEFRTEAQWFRGHWAGGEELGECHGLMLGDRIEVVTKAPMSDIGLADDVEPLDHPWKDRLREILAKREALGEGDDEGWVILCRQTLRTQGGLVIDGPTTHEETLSARLQRLAAMPVETFRAMVEAVGLTPERDLRFQNLSGCPLDGQDLSGFDFTGADLSGSTFARATLAGKIVKNREIAGAVFDLADVSLAALSEAADFDAWLKGDLKRPANARRKVNPARLPDLARFREAPFAPEMVVIPAGEYWMGSDELDDEAYEDEKGPDGKKRRMVIPERFALGKYPVTFEEYLLFCELANRKPPPDEGWAGKRRPVINVSWNDANAYAAWLNERLGAEFYSLPGEVQWERACRAGTPTRRWWGDAWDPSRANGARSFEGGRTSPVGHYGEKGENNFKLSDMIGNVWEWCADVWTKNLSDLPADGRPYQPALKRSRSYKKQNNDVNSPDRALRGGAWNSVPRNLRSAIRSRNHPGNRNNDVGFRLSRTLLNPDSLRLYFLGVRGEAPADFFLTFAQAPRTKRIARRARRARAGVMSIWDGNQSCGACRTGGPNDKSVARSYEWFHTVADPHDREIPEKPEIPARRPHPIDGARRAGAADRGDLQQAETGTSARRKSRRREAPAPHPHRGGLALSRPEPLRARGALARRSGAADWRLGEA